MLSISSAFSNLTLSPLILTELFSLSFLVSGVSEFLENHKQKFGLIITEDRLDMKGNVMLMPLWLFLAMCWHTWIKRVRWKEVFEITLAGRMGLGWGTIMGLKELKENGYTDEKFILLMREGWQSCEEV